MRSISILGCGWLGLPLGKYLAGKKYQVRGSTTHQQKLSNISEGGIRPYLIALRPEIDGDPGDFFRSDILLINLPPRNKDGEVDFHLRQLKAIRDSARGEVENIVFISSTGIYPNKNMIVKEEDADPDCLSRGGVSLLEAEQVFSLTPEFRTTVIRFGGLYGPERHPGRFFAGRKNLTGAKNPVNMIHLEDCLGVISAIIEQDIWGETFNACSPVERTRESFYQSAAVDLGLEPPSFSEMPAAYKKVSVEKLLSMTGYRFVH